MKDFMGKEVLFTFKVPVLGPSQSDNCHVIERVGTVHDCNEFGVVFQSKGKTPKFFTPWHRVLHLVDTVPKEEAK